MATEDISGCQSLGTKEKNNGDAENQVAINNPSANDNILEKNEILYSVVKLETNDTEGAQVENSINQNITGGFIQKHIELEPIDIKDEPFQSDIEEMREDETTRSYESENIMPKPPRKRRKRNLPEEEQPNPNKCHFCDIDFESKSELHSHLECHKEMLPYECKRCSTEANPIIFTTVVLLNKHLETHGFRFVCQQCPLRFRTNMQVRYHMADAHNEHKFEYDGKVFSNIYAYQRYIRDYRNLVMQKFKCESCHKRFKNTTLLKRHLAFHRRQELAAAGKAAKKRKVEIDDHPKVVKTIPNKCYVCDTFLENESAFDNHLESHKNMLPFECSRCSTETNPIRLVTVSALNEHFESHGFYYSCSLCPLRFRTNSLLIHHKYNHKKKRLGTENSKSKTANSIKTEKNVETAGRPKRKRGPRIDPKMVKRIPNKCYICDTVHESESDFHHHLESHNIMLPFECSRCSTEKHSIKLSTVISLNKHIERHDFFYACPHCPSRFRTNNTLIHHKYTHGRKRSKTENASTSTIKQSYKCEPCQKHFWSIHMFERHKTSILCKHNIELARLGMITTEISNSTPLQTEEESDAKDTNPIVASNSPENDNILVENEIDSRNNLSSTVKLEPEDFDEKKADIAVYIQDQIQVEPIDIKDEPFDSISAPFDDDEATHILQNESNKPELTKKQVNSKPPTVVETIENKCYICGTILGSKSEFTNHLESHKEMLPYKCLQCSTETNLLICKNTYLLNKHFESHGFSYECRQCPLRFRTSTTRSRHKERAHDEHNLEHSCEICGKVFNNISTFRNHLFAHRNLMMQRYKCQTCEKYFPTSYGLRQHAKTHIESVGNTAQKTHPEVEQTENDKNETPNTVKRKRSKKIVEVQVEAEVVEKENSNKCNVCGTELANSSELNKHLECHSDMLPFECPQCSTKAAPIKLLTVIALHRHFKRHSYDYVCPYCPLKYLSQRVLARHVHDKHDKNFIRKRKNSRPEVEVTVEKKEDPNKCNVCGTEVANSKELKVHLKCHEDMLPYECPQCSTEANPMKILGVIGLHKHFKRHSYDYVCPYCPLKYLSKRILSHHIRTKHDKNFAFNRKPSSVPDSTTIEMSKSQLLLNEEKSTDETTSGSAEQTFSTNLHMNSGNMPNEIGGSNNPSSILVLNPTVDVIKTEIVDL